MDIASILGLALFIALIAMHFRGHGGRGGHGARGCHGGGHHHAGGGPDGRPGSRHAPS